MRRPLLLAALGFVMLGASAAAQDAADHGDRAAVRPVSVGFDRVTPVRVDVVTGEMVRWTNDSVRTHTVTADDESFDSGRLGTGNTFERRFTTAAEVPYHCLLHPIIQGVVAVADLLLEAPAAAASPKRPFILRGRAGRAVSAGAPVSLEADSGAGFTPVTTATVGDDGSFSASFVPTATATYRAVAGTLTSPPVQLLVLDRRMSLTATRSRGAAVTLRTTVSPASPRGHVVLQLFLPERFGWWPVRKARLDARSSARFTLRSQRRLRARVVLTLPDGATRLALSRVVRVGPRR